ncbi:glutathione S-transferase [Syncephalis plumigaleata]|nr:glutathione S-transferase [Syncephalis plumigaleata]
MTITSVPKVTYFRIPYEGLGGPINMMLTDAGVEYTFSDFTFEEWPAIKQKLIDSGLSPNGTVPLLELDGKSYVHQLPIMRVLARHLGKYGGNNDYEAYEIDSYADLLNDYNKAWGVAHWGDDNDKAKFVNEQQPRYLDGVNRFLAQHEGPYLLGNEISYADFKLQTILMDAKLTSFDDYPNIKAFSEAIRARSGVAKYMSTRA